MSGDAIKMPGAVAGGASKLGECGLNMTLIVRSSGIHEAGCYTLSRIRRGTFVVEYTGPRVSQKKGDERYEQRPHTFLFGLRDGKTLIDGHGLAAFINHSCDPNCETDEIRGRV